MSTQPTSAPSVIVIKEPTFTYRLRRAMHKYWQLYLLMSVPLLWYIIFQYTPMYGVQIAFRNYDPSLGFLRSPWVGMQNFVQFFQNYFFWPLIRNTVEISLYSLAVGFPIPILLALLVNEIKNNKFKKLVQNITYVPYFISAVAVVGMLLIFLSPQTGLVNIALQHLTGRSINFMTMPGWFKTIYVFSDVWQNMGWNAIIYIAALSSISPSLYEAAEIDGASRMARLWHISLPGILPIVITLLILNTGHLMDVGFEKILLMQNPLNLPSSNVIATYVYDNGIQLGQYSLAAAVGLFNSVINFALLVIVNWIARRKSEHSLW